MKNSNARYFVGYQWLEALYLQSRKNAIKRKIDFTLTYEQLSEIATRSKGRCEISHIPFEFRVGTEKATFRRPFYPSIDRIDSGKDYSATNCRLVCVAVNTAMNEWGQDTLFRIARGIADPDCERQVKGVRMRQSGGKTRYVATIRLSGLKDQHLGTFDTLREAEIALSIHRRRATAMPQESSSNAKE